MPRLRNVWFVLISVCSMLAASQSSSGQVCESCFSSSGSASGQCCPDAVPLLEQDAAINLYWHDRCDCIDDPCLEPSCVTSHTATWYGSAELVALFRDQTRGELYQLDATTGLGALQESDFDAEFSAGVRGTLGVALGDWYRLESTYTGGFNWEESCTIRNNDINALGTAGNLMSPFSDFGNPAIAGVDYNNLASISMSSEMNSFEINLRRRVVAWHRRARRNQMFMRPWHGSSSLFLNRRAETSFLVGVRYMRIEEGFSYLTQSVEPLGAGSNNSAAVQTDNDMIGAQIGMLSQFSYRDRTWLDVEIKGGIYHNQSKVGSSYVNTDAVGTVLGSFSGEASEDETSWAGDLSVVLNHQVTRCMTFRIGYNAVAIADVALASNTFSRNVNTLALGPVQNKANDDIVYHGPSLGLVFTR